MDYSDAKMERGAERQELLDGLKRKVMKMEDEGGRLMTQVMLSEVMTRYLAVETGEIVPAYPHSCAKNLFYDELLLAIKDFSRTEQERNALVADLLAWVNQSFVGYFANQLMIQENHQPELLFSSDLGQEQLL